MRRSGEIHTRDLSGLSLLSELMQSSFLPDYDGEGDEEQAEGETYPQADG